MSVFAIRTILFDSAGPAVRTLQGVAAAALLCLAVPSPAQAGFTPNDLAVSFSSLLNNATNTDIGNLLTTDFKNAGYGGKVTVSGAIGSNSYTGDGHVVGPNGSSDTLHTMDGGTFIQNNTGTNPSSTAITIKFSQAISLSKISFDFEIFPDGTCPTGNNCGSNLPDISVTDTYKPKSGTTNVTAQIFQRFGVVPGQTGATPVACTGNTSQSGNCGGSGSDSPSLYTHSPNSGPINNEMAPQLLGSSGQVALNLPTGNRGVTTLTFNDWPATIAINHLVFDPVPEPGSLLLLASGLVGLGILRVRKII